MIDFGNFCKFFEIFTEALEQNIKKVIQYVFQMKKQTNKAKLEIIKFLRISLYRKAIVFDRIGGNYALSPNSIKICLLGYFCMQN